ncbi:hypothetical protein HID58_060882, partial [Brassica napus]
AKTKDLGLRGLPLQHNNGFISTTKVPRTSPRKKPPQNFRAGPGKKTVVHGLGRRMTPNFSTRPLKPQNEQRTCFLLNFYIAFYINVIVDGSNMWRKHAWTKHARYAEINKKTQKGEARQVDKAGRCVHVSCLQNPSQSSNWCSIWSIKKKIGGSITGWIEYVEKACVDKTCKICRNKKKDTKGEARQVDKSGRCVHVSCLQNPSQSSGNFFTRLFST